MCFRLSSLLLQIPAVLWQAGLSRGSDELYEQCKPTGRELTVFPSSSCSQKLITWPEYKRLALYAFFFLQTTLKGFISRIPF